MREILTHGSVRGSNAHPRNTHPKAQKQKCGHRAKVESKDCGLVLYSTTDRTGIQLVISVLNMRSDCYHLSRFPAYNLQFLFLHPRT